MVEIKLENCNNISKANLTLHEGETTVLFGMNGVGKSTVANVMMHASKDEAALSTMCPYGSDTSPSVSGVPVGASVLVFNEEYIENALFRGDAELIDNGYRVFVETPDYKEAAFATEKLFEDAKSKLETQCEVSELLRTVEALLDCYGRSKGGFAANSAIGKGVAKKGDLVTNMPQQFRAFRPLITSEFGKGWIQWHKKGADYNGLGVCPYCGNSKFDVGGIELCDSLQDAYGSKYLDNCLKVFKAFENADKCLSEKARSQIDSALHGKLVDGAFSDEHEALLNSIRIEAEALRRKLEGIKFIGYSSLKSIKDKVQYFKELKIDLDLIDKMDSAYVREKVERINAVIDGLVSDAVLLQSTISKQTSALGRSIRKAKDDINGFLEAAGFPYELSLVSEDGETCSVSLKPQRRRNNRCRT